MLSDLTFWAISAFIYCIRLFACRLVFSVLSLSLSSCLLCFFFFPFFLLLLLFTQFILYRTTGQHYEKGEGGTQWGLRIGIEIGTKRLVFFSFGIGIRHDSRNLQQYFIKAAHTGDPRAVVKRCPRLACEREDILGYIIYPTVG